MPNILKQEIRVVVISDLNGEYGTTSYAPEVIKSISLIKQWKPDLVLCAGDMIAGQKYSLTKKQIQSMWMAFNNNIALPLKQLKIPFGFSLGNHDASGAMYRDQLTFYKERIIASNYLRDAVVLLGGTIQYQEIIDTTGKSAKRIIITYNEEKKASN